MKIVQLNHPIITFPFLLLLVLGTVILLLLYFTSRFPFGVFVNPLINYAHPPFKPSSPISFPPLWKFILFKKKVPPPKVHAW